MTINFSYSYTGSSEYDFKSAENNTENVLLRSIDGFQGVDHMPPVGSTVTVFSNVIGTDGDMNFRPSLNNKFYWLVSDEVITDRDTIISLGSPISVSLSGGRYTGTFVFANPNNYRYLYIVADYKCSIPDGGALLTHTFSAGEQAIIDSITSIKPGQNIFSWNPTSGPIRFRAYVNDTLIVDSGETNTAGTATYSKVTYQEERVRIILDNTPASNSVDFGFGVGELIKFSIDPTNGTLSNVCSQSPSIDLRHSGSGVLPIQGDIVYTNSTGDVRYNGGDAYHLMASVIGPGTDWILIGTDGVVKQRGSCVCSEISVPTITQGDVEVKVGQSFSIEVEASNNPTSWVLVSSSDVYELNGGVKGAVYTYTDVNGTTQRITVGINQTTQVSAQAAPTLITGTGTDTLIGPNPDTSLPKGVSFKDGIISGSVLETGSYEIELIATNCVGNSANATFSILATSQVTLKPFPIDVNQFEKTGAASCLITGNWDLLYHNGYSDLPVLNDIVYTDPNGVYRFKGGNFWYFMLGSLYSIKVDEFGKVIETHTC